MTRTSVPTTFSIWAAHQCQEGKRLYAVVDAARNRAMAFEARDRHGLNIRWLFSDNVSSSMADVAPYLVEVAFGPGRDGHGFLKEWSGKQGNNNGILLLTAAAPGVTWLHLRRVFVATDDTRQSYYFRFYDPRVLRTFLPACNAAEATEFFGPIELILVEGEPASRLLSCHLNGASVSLEDWRTPSSGRYDRSRRGRR